LFAAGTFAQSEVVWRKDISAEKLYVDKTGNIYTLANNVISKYDEKMDFVCRYDNYSAGSISMLDVSNPFKLLAFVSEFNKLMYLDNNLTELRSPINLDDAGLYNVPVVCSSSFGGFWIFDSQNSCVKRVAMDLTTTQNGTSLYNVLNDSEILQMLESVSYIFLLTSQGDILILDKFGNFIRTLDFDSEVASFCVDNDILYYSLSGAIHAYNISVDSSAVIAELPSVKAFGVRHDLLYCLYDKELVCMRISNK
ncbi:MAG: hypothetical protein HUK15_03315, partial [Bacteroidales bacterium]|nr:hypothetical protein [Bacteroidales bacterium]